MRYIYDELISFFGFVVAIMIPIIVTIVGLNEYTRYQCKNYSQITQKETKYANFDACYVKTEQGFQHWDEYKIRAAASEGLSTKKDK